MAKKAEILEFWVISHLREWGEAQLTEIKNREEKVAAKLRAAIPESFAKWREEASDSIISNLIQFGRSSRKYRRDEGEGRTYGYTDLEEFGRRFKQLQAAWSSVVRIKIIWEDDYRFEIFFTAL
ncbi:MAG: hypothetical protein WC348_04930 [Patescibacteria group bacterium]|jgi:uncharacterized protein (DUF924 family)